MICFCCSHFYNHKITIICDSGYSMLDSGTNHKLQKPLSYKLQKSFIKTIKMSSHLFEEQYTKKIYTQLIRLYMQHRGEQNIIILSH